jgi:CRISPR-associated protein Csc2
MSVLDTYDRFFLERYNNYPQGRYISVLLVREIESEAIFRTEGSGEPLNKEFVHAGLAADSNVIQRVVISKRKQTAVERRTGRDLLRQYDLLHNTKGETCTLNTNKPCEQCIDCMIYGYAAGGGGAQRSRVVTDDAFSLHSAPAVVDKKQFNALYDNSTMRDPETRKASTSIGTDEYVRPESIFLDIETLRDLTRDEFVYVIGNILRSSRSGAISSRIGKVRNHIAGVIFSNCEVFSNLELTQAVFDSLSGHAAEPNFPLHVSDIMSAISEESLFLAKRMASPLTILEADEVARLVDEITAIYQNEQAIRQHLQNASSMYGPGIP